MSKSNSSTSGLGFTSLLLLAFIVLKLCKVIDWSWWWVLSPAWITACIAFIVLAVFFILKKSDKENKNPTYKRKLEERIEEMRNSKKNNN